jgi:hypothetical protein
VDLVAISKEEYVKCNIEIMKAYCDTAKSYVQIASAAIAAPFVFTQVILGRSVAEAGMKVPWSLAVAWLCFLTTVGSGLVYQWLAIRLAACWLDGEETKFSRSIPYAVMVASFFGGACSFVVFAWNLLGKRML